MTMKIAETIRDMRKRRGLSQEVLAEAMGVTVQAVSKWECETSLPDIALLPVIAEYFGLSMDELFFGERPLRVQAPTEIPDDGKLRIVQFSGKTCLGQQLWRPDAPIPLDLAGIDAPVEMEIWGSASINGDVHGPVNCGDSVNCGAVHGDVKCGDSVHCGNVQGGVQCGDSVHGGNVGGDIQCGDSVTCGNVIGNIECGDGIQCGDVTGDIECSDSATCGNVKGNVHAEGDIQCGVINGGSIRCQTLYCKGDIRAEQIQGEVEN